MAYSSQYPDAIRSLSPNAYWRLGEPSGIIAIDDTGEHTGGYFNDPSLAEPGLLQGDASTSVLFGATNGYVRLPATLNSFVPACIMALIHCEDTEYTTMWAGGPNGSPGMSFGINVNGSIIIRATSGLVVLDSDPGIIGLNHTHHVVFTYEAGQNRLYVDGVQVASTGGSNLLATTIIEQSYLVAKIAAGGAASSAKGNTRLQEVVIFDYGLTAAQVLYLSETSKDAPAPVPGVMNDIYLVNNLSILTGIMGTHATDCDPTVEGACDSQGSGFDVILTPDISNVQGQIDNHDSIVVILRNDNVSITGNINNPSLFEATLDSIKANMVGSSFYSNRISEGVNITTDSVSYQKYVPKIHENILVSTTIYKLVLVFTHLLSESISINTRLVRLWEEIVYEAINISSISVPSLAIRKVILEVINSDSLSSSKMSMLQYIHELLTVLDDNFLSTLLTLQEGVSVRSLASAIAQYLTTIHEQILNANSFSMQFNIVAMLHESTVVSNNITPQIIFNLLLNDSIVFSGLTELGGEHYTFATNTKTLGLSEYVNYNFTSLSQGLACNSMGIYNLNDSTDAEVIEAEIKTGFMDFGNSKHKQVPYAYLGLTNDNNMVLKTITDHNGVRKEYWYELTLSTNAEDTRRIQLGRGIKSRYWQFAITNKNGANFDLDSVELMPLTLSRRI